MYFDVINGETCNFHWCKVTLTSFETSKLWVMIDERFDIIQAQRKADRLAKVGVESLQRSKMVMLIK